MTYIQCTFEKKKIAAILDIIPSNFSVSASIFGQSGPQIGPAARGANLPFCVIQPNLGHIMHIK